MLARTIGRCWPDRTLQYVRRQFDDLTARSSQMWSIGGRLLLTELVTNSVLHAGLGPAQRIDLGLSILTDLVGIEVGDGGRGCSPALCQIPSSDRAGGCG